MEPKLNLPMPVFRKPRTTHPILAFSLVRDLITQLQPALLSPDLFSGKVLDDIETYLLYRNKPIPDALQESICEELFLALEGMKTLLEAGLGDIDDINRYLDNENHEAGERLHDKLLETEGEYT